MRRFVSLSFLIGLIFIRFSYAQTTDDIQSIQNDSIPRQPIEFSAPSASEYIIGLLKNDTLWRSSQDEKMKQPLERLIGQYQIPYDTIKSRLENFEYDSVSVVLTWFRQHDTIPIKWLNTSTFIADTIALEKEPFIIKQTIIESAIDSVDNEFQYVLQDPQAVVDSAAIKRDTITEVFIDSLFLEERNIRMHQIIEEQIVPPVIIPRSNQSVRFLSDSTGIVITRSSNALVAGDESPFYIVPGELMIDSLRKAVETLLTYTEERDSILLFVSDKDGRQMPFWLSTIEADRKRIWVKNHANDSITIWMGNPSKNNLTLLLEDNVNVERRGKKLANEIPISTLRPQRSLASVSPLAEIPVFWDHGFSSALTLNENYFSNWAKGGETSLASMVDIGANAKYTNKALKSTWTNTGRLRYGSIITKVEDEKNSYQYRTNTDMIELNSQYNRVLRDKIDFSSVLYFKTQIAYGYKNPRDTVPISKFLNPGTFTVGVGVEYKPVPKTTLNFSPLSYRNTFVLDTAQINQKNHGIDTDKKARQEMGGQLVIRSSVTILNGLNVTNNIRLFSGYLEKPENVDVDWEISLDKQISWFFMVRLNFHTIYDDDIRFTVEDKEGQPVKLPDGSTKRIPKVQFKQFLGLTLSFRI
jgi:hypothetical protein